MISSQIMFLALGCLLNSHTAAGDHLPCGLALLPCISDDHVENTWELIM